MEDFKRKMPGKKKFDREEDSNRDFDRSKVRGSKRFDRKDSKRRDGRGRGSFENRSRTKYPERESKHGSRNRRDFEMTKVTCSSCGDECEVPFKPTSNKPIYCDNCFKKEDNRSSNKSSNGLSEINKKLDKIMEALKIK